MDIIPKLSDNCIKRIMLAHVTSPDMIMIVGCQIDMVMIPLMRMFHKESIGCIVVAIDMLGILIMAMCVHASTSTYSQDFVFGIFIFGRGVV